jgi:hypothetical protein
MILSYEQGVPTLPQFFRDVDCPGNGSQWTPTTRHVGMGYFNPKSIWCSNNQWADTQNCPLPLIQSMIIPSNMKVGFKAKWDEDIATRVTERGQVWVEGGVYSNLNDKPLVWNHFSDGISACSDYDSTEFGRTNTINNDPSTIAAGNVDSLYQFKSKMNRSIVSCGSPFLPSVSIYYQNGRRCDEMTKMYSDNNKYYRQTGYMVNEYNSTGRKALTPAQGALSQLLKYSTDALKKDFTQNLNPLTICTSTTGDRYQQLDSYFMNGPSNSNNYTPGTTLIWGDTINSNPWGSRNFVGDLMLYSDWQNATNGTTPGGADYLFDRVCAIYRRGKWVDPYPKLTYNIQDINDPRTALNECAGLGQNVEDPATISTTSPCDCVPNSLYHYLAHIMFRTTIFAAVHDTHPGIEGCSCPKPWRIEGTIAEVNIAFKNHNFGWDYEKAMLCAGMWDVTIDNISLKAYYHGSPLCDEHMISYCKRNIDDRLKTACTCVTQAQALQDMFQDSTALSLHCLINSCNDARSNVYKTRLQKELRCNQNVCEQKIDIDGSAINLNSTSNVICTSQTNTNSTILSVKPNSGSISITKNAPQVSTGPGMWDMTLLGITSFIAMGIAIFALLVYWYMRRQHRLKLEKLQFRHYQDKKTS